MDCRRMSGEESGPIRRPTVGSRTSPAVNSRDRRRNRPQRPLPRRLLHPRWRFYATGGLTKTLAAAGVRCVRLPPKSPNLNAYAERFVRSIKSECLDRMIFFGGKHLRYAINEYVQHYHMERNHQGLGNRLIERSGDYPGDSGQVLLRTRLGGMLKYYYRAAA